MHKGRGHFWVSYCKSLVRLVSCVIASCTLSAKVLAIGFLIAELLGILEEIIDDR